MKTKHYVSLEVAKMLKEKGFNESCIVLWDEEFKELIPASSICSYKNQNHPNGYCSAPSLLEAMDRLEERGVHIEIRMMHCKVKGDPYKIADDDEYQWKWYFVIYKDNDVKHPIVEEGEDGYVVMHSDKNECMNAAVKKGAELL